MNAARKSNGSTTYKGDDRTVDFSTDFDHGQNLLGDELALALRSDFLKSVT